MSESLFEHSNMWWRKLEPHQDERHELVLRVVEELRDDHEYLDSFYQKWLHLYTNRVYSGFGPGDARNIVQMITTSKSKIKLNVIQSCIDTLASKICAQRPAPQFLTSGGDWKQMRKAKGLEKFVSGVFYQSKIYEQARKMFVDAAVFGTGFLKVYSEQGKVKCERVFPSEIVVDEGAATTSEPRSMFHVKQISADAVVALFAKGDAKKAAAIRGAVDSQGSALRVTNDGEHIERCLVEVIEAWHLPSVDGAGDGLHTIIVDGCTLTEEKWTRNSFPFVTFRWNMLPFGYFGQGLCEQLAGAQLEVDKLITRIQEAMHLMSVAKIYATKNSIDKENIRNASGDIVWINEGHQAPVTQMPSSVNNEVFSHLWSIVSKMYEISGISQLSASSVKPAGVESGVALRTLLDTETQRFALLARDWEEFFCSAAKMVVEEAKAHSGTVKTMWVAKSFAETIDFKSVDLHEDSYVLKVYPTNLLPQTPAGRLSTVQEMLQAGFIAPQEAMALLDFPDLEQSQSLMRSSRDLVDRDIEMMMDGEEAPAPRQWQDLDLAMSRVVMSLQKAEQDGAPDSVLERLKQYLDTVEDLLTDQEAQAQQRAMLEQAAAQMGGPGGPGGGMDPSMAASPADQMMAPPEEQQ